MMNNLKIRQEHTNQKVGNFGSKKLGVEVIDRMIVREEIRQMKRRVLCKDCMTYKSVTGSCFC